MRPKSTLIQECVLACCLLTATAMTTSEKAARHAAGNVSTGTGRCNLVFVCNTYAQYLRKLSAPAAVVLGDEPVELALCDCEFATGPPNGLSCDKEGWFVSSFEREGSWVRPLVLASSSTLFEPFAAVQHILS